MKKHGQSLSSRNRSGKSDRENPEGVSILKKSKVKFTASPSPARKSPVPKRTRKNITIEPEPHSTTTFTASGANTSPAQSPMKRKGPPEDSSSFLELTPESLSQISSIMPPDDSTMMSKHHSPSKKRRQADRTMELAVQQARGEPDGADGSFRKSPKSPKGKASRKLMDIPEVSPSNSGAFETASASSSSVSVVLVVLLCYSASKLSLQLVLELNFS